MKRFLVLAILLTTSLLLSQVCLAEEEKTKSLEGVEFFTGFGWGKLRHKKDYHITPFIVDFDFNFHFTSPRVFDQTPRRSVTAILIRWITGEFLLLFLSGANNDISPFLLNNEKMQNDI